MGALTPIMMAVQTALPVINTVSTLAGQVRGLTGSGNSDQKLALRQLEERQALEMQDAQNQAAFQKAQLDQQAQDAETARRAALRRAVATQRAQFGSNGVSGGSGSGEAVLLGLYNESDEDRAERERLNNLKSQAIDYSLANQNSLNVLQRSQLAARQKLQNTLF